MVFKVSKDNPFILVAGKISSKNTLLLKTEKKYDELLVIGTIKTVSEYLISLDDLQVFTLSEVSDDNSHSASKTEPDVEDKKVAAPPIHRRFTSANLGSGVLVIVVVEVLLHDDAHTLGFKSILGLGILWLSYWVYAELRFRGKASRFLAATVALGLILAASALTVLAYASLGNQQSPKQQVRTAQASTTPAQIALPPPTTPVPSVPKLSAPTANSLAVIVPIPTATVTITPQVKMAPPADMAFSKFTPESLCEQVQLALPLQKDAIGKSFAGSPVKWTLQLYNVSPSVLQDAQPFVHFITKKSPPVFVTISLDKGDVPFLKTAKEKDKFIVSGTIEEVDGRNVRLSNARIKPTN